MRRSSFRGLWVADVKLFSLRHVFREFRHVSREPRLVAARDLYRSSQRERTPEARGRKLLREWLSPAQRETFDAYGYVDVLGSESGQRYRIYYGSISNIRELNEKDDPVAGLCFAPAAALPPGDVMLAQKIVLENDESRALAIANRFHSTSQPIQVRNAHRAR